MKEFFTKHPAVTGLVAIVVAYLGVQLLSMPIGIVGNIVAAVLGGADLTIPVSYLSAAIGALLVLVVFNVIYKKQGFKGVFGFAKTNLKDVYIGLIILMVVDIACLIFTAIVGEGGFSALVLPSFLTFALACAAGVSEEAMFRAIPAALMMKNKADSKRIVLTILVTSIAFGVFHFTNITQGAALITTIGQVIFASIMGIFFIAVYLRTGSIVIPMFFHFFHDFINFMIASQSTGVMTQASLSMIDLIPEFTLGICELVIAFYLLRKVNFDEILSIWKNKWSE